jgi:hypothetical protein
MAGQGLAAFAMAPGMVLARLAAMPMAPGTVFARLAVFATAPEMAAAAVLRPCLAGQEMAVMPMAQYRCRVGQEMAAMPMAPGMATLALCRCREGDRQTMAFPARLAAMPMAPALKSQPSVACARGYCTWDFLFR